MREIYIRKEVGMDIAVLEDGRLVEYLPDAGESSAEAIYLGKVERIMPGMKAAFVNIGQERSGFLPLEERSCSGLPKLQTGMPILVQVSKEAHDQKGAFLTRDVSLCGEFVLLSPMNRMLAVSSRITSKHRRRSLKELAGDIAGESFGLVMRSASQHASEELIRAEVAELLAKWENIRREAPTAHVPSVLHKPRTALDMVLADYHPRGIDRICTNDAALAKALSGLAHVQVMNDNLFDVGRVSTQVMKALDRRVWLESGGNLVFDPCEAMTVIDVNTAKFTGKTALTDTVLQTNLEACAEIARQVRLRNISGIIIIDMIDMPAKEAQHEVLSALEEAFRLDRVKTVVHGFTSLGLVEMTRRRSRQPLKDLIKKDTNQLED